MNISIKPKLLKYLILSFGVLGLSLRVALYATGIDEKGLLVDGHWASTASFVLTAVAAVVLILSTCTLTGPTAYHDCYGVSPAAGLGAFAAAAGIGLTMLREGAGSVETAALPVRLMGLASMAAFVAIGVCRLLGRKPYFLLHGLICLYFGLRMVLQYQQWRSDPQLQDYCFYLGAYIGLMITAYQHAAFDADMGRHRSLWQSSLAAVYLCCLSLNRGQDNLLLMGCGIWAFLSLTHLEVRPRRQRPALHLEDAPVEGADAPC